MSRWFRVYDDLVDDPKVQRLPADTFRGLINLWCLASKGNGILPLLAEIAFKLRISEPKATKLLDDLVAAGLIEHDETGVHPHNWSGRQFKSDVSNERVKRHRERKCNVTSAATATPPETEQKTDTEREAIASQARERAKAQRAAFAIEFENIFWVAWPCKESKKDALKAFLTAREKAELETIMAGVTAYKLAKPPDRSWSHAASWLNKERWNDEYVALPPVQSNGYGPDLSLDNLKARIAERAAREGATH